MKLLTKLLIFALLFIGTTVCISMKGKIEATIDGGTRTEDDKENFKEKKISEYLDKHIISLGININIRIENKNEKVSSFDELKPESIHQHGRIIIKIEGGETLQLHVVKDDSSSKLFFEVSFVEEKYLNFANIRLVPLTQITVSKLLKKIIPYFFNEPISYNPIKSNDDKDKKKKDPSDYSILIFTDKSRLVQNLKKEYSYISLQKIKETKEFLMENLHNPNKKKINCFSFLFEFYSITQNLFSSPNFEMKLENEIMTKVKEILKSINGEKLIKKKKHH